jgi:hypothetical protein
VAGRDSFCLLWGTHPPHRPRTGGRLSRLGRCCTGGGDGVEMEGAVDGCRCGAIKLSRVKPQLAGRAGLEPISLAVELSSGWSKGSTVNRWEQGAPTATLRQRPSLLGNARRMLVYHDQEPRIIHPPSILPSILLGEESRDRPESRYQLWIDWACSSCQSTGCSSGTADNRNRASAPSLRRFFVDVVGRSEIRQGRRETDCGLVKT